MKKLIVIALMALTGAMATQAQLSVETLGAIRSVGITKGEQYGVGLSLGYDFNKYVSGYVRALKYSDNDWTGNVVDEGSLLGAATFFRSANGKVRLQAIGGADRDFVADDWGFSVGPRVSYVIYKGLSFNAESRIRAWFKQEKDLISSASLSYSF